MESLNKTLEKNVSKFSNLQVKFNKIPKQFKTGVKSVTLKEKINSGLEEAEFMKTVSEYVNIVLMENNNLKQKNDLLKDELEYVRSKLIKSEIHVDELVEKLENLEINAKAGSKNDNKCETPESDDYYDYDINSPALADEEDEEVLLPENKQESYYKEILSANNRSSSSNSNSDMRPIWKVAEDMENIQSNRLFPTAKEDSYRYDFDYLAWYNRIGSGPQFFIVNSAVGKLAVIYRRQGMFNAAKFLEHCYVIQNKKRFQESSMDSSGYTSRSENDGKY